MPKDTMTSRQRLLAAVNFEPFDRLPFWPKLDGAYLARYGAALSASSIADMHRFLGTDQHVMGGGGYRYAFRNGTLREVRKSDSELIYIYRVGGRELTERQVWDVPSCSWVPVQHPVKSAEDVLLMAQFYRDASIEPDERAIDEWHAHMADTPNALNAWIAGESPLMYFVEWMAGVEQAHYLLADSPDEVEQMFAEYQRVLLDKLRFGVEHMRADMYYFIENTSTTLISPAQYARYCAPHIAQYGEICRAAGKRLALHMCGHLKLLLPQLAQSPASLFEAFTSPTVGNVGFRDGRAALPDKCLFGGTNATTWLKSVPEIISEIEQSLDGLPLAGLALSSGGVMPPACTPDTIRQVNQWLAAHTALT